MTGDRVLVVRRQRYPADDPPWPGCEEVKAAAAKVGRARSLRQEDAAMAKLSAVLDELDDEALRLWAGVAMIDHRWQASTGAGGFWAKASGAVNAVARRLIGERWARWCLTRGSRP